MRPLVFLFYAALLAAQGTYRNPILPADFSDPDVIRVGGDYYLVASDFHFIGIQVLHSTDLVHWRVINQVFHRLSIAPKYDAMQAYSEGTWAPSLRYHNGTYYLYVCTPKDGLFMWRTRNPAGQWSEMVTVKSISGWEDPNPFWDDDGQAYLLHSKTGAGPLILHKMSADGTRLLDDGATVYTGPVAEGPKLLKRNGYYYIAHPEGGVSTGWQAMARSKNIYGPYENRAVLAAGPHQGNIVDTPSGESWFIGFQSADWQGRLAYLEPVKWPSDPDAWPIFGDNGKPVETWPVPTVDRPAGPVTQTSDEFTSKELSPVWQWNHNPVDTAWSLSARRGYLRLTSLPAPDLQHARNTITQKLWEKSGTVEVKFDVSKLADQQRAGLTFIGGTVFEWIAAERRAGEIHVVWSSGNEGLIVKDAVWFRGTYRDGNAALEYSVDGQVWHATPQQIVLKAGSWKGARLGLFTYGPIPGPADVDYVHYQFPL